MQTEKQKASGTGTVTQKITIPTGNEEYILDLGENSGKPTSQIKITTPDGTEENYTITNNQELKNIPVKPGATVEITTTLEAGESVDEVKVLVKDKELNSSKKDTATTIENNKQWVTVEKQKYVYNNGGTGYWEKCYINDTQVDETGIITNEEEPEKRIKVSYQVSADGITWSKTFSNIEEAKNTKHLKVIVEYQTIDGKEYGDTSNNKIKITLNDGTWNITFQDEDGTELFTKIAYFQNSNKQGTITIPNLEKTKNGKQFVCWKADGKVYNPGSTYTAQNHTTFTAYYSKTGIYTVDDLCQFRDEVNSGVNFIGKTIEVMNDIDLSSVCYKVDGTVANDVSWEPIGNYGTDETHYFSGTFDGNNHTIGSIYINSEKNYQGLFGCNEGIIRNLIVTGRITSKYDYVGGITGINKNIISNCRNQAYIRGNNVVGGIAGWGEKNCIIERCCNTNEVYATRNAGGILGDTYDAIIKLCYNTGYIHASDMTAGGISGYQAGGNVYNCYNIGKITAGNTIAGGICGAAGSSITAKVYTYNCYNLGSVSAPQYGGTIVGLANANGGSSQNVNSYTTNATADLLNAGSYSDNVWTSVEEINGGYPILKWQLKEIDD